MVYVGCFLMAFEKIIRHAYQTVFKSKKLWIDILKQKDSLGECHCFCSWDSVILKFTCTKLKPIHFKFLTVLQAHLKIAKNEAFKLNFI